MQPFVSVSKTVLPATFSSPEPNVPLARGGLYRHEEKVALEKHVWRIEGLESWNTIITDSTQIFFLIPLAEPMSCLLHASCLQYTYERTVLIWEWLLTIRKQDPRTTAFVVTSRSIGTKITDKTKASNESCTRQNSQKDNKEGFQYPGYPIDGTQWSENQSINPNQSIKLVNWYRLVSVNRWSIDNHTKIVHRLASIGRGPRNIRLTRYLSDHPPFFRSPVDDQSLLSTKNIIDKQQVDPNDKE